VSAATLGSALLPAAVGLLVARLGLGAVSAVTLGLGLAFLIVHEWLLRVTAATPVGKALGSVSRAR
jgi:hypothetical protein